MQHDLQQYVAELLLHPFIFAGIDRVDEFVALFDQMRFKATVSLFKVPGASIRRPKPGHNISQAFQWRTHYSVTVEYAKRPRFAPGMQKRGRFAYSDAGRGLPPIVFQQLCPRALQCGALLLRQTIQAVLGDLLEQMIDFQSAASTGLGCRRRPRPGLRPLHYPQF